MSRIYRIGGTDYVSVTTVLEALPKPWLAPWTARIVAEAAYDEWWEHMTGEEAERWPGMERADAVRHLKGTTGRLTDHPKDRGTAVHAATIMGDWTVCPE